MNVIFDQPDNYVAWYQKCAPIFSCLSWISSRMC